MRFVRAIIAILAGAALVGVVGCGSSSDCADAVCSTGDSMTISLEGVATTYAYSLPLSIKLCVGSACTTFAIASTGQAGTLECHNETGGDEICSIDGMGAVVVSSLPLPDGAAPGAAVVVSAEVTPAKGSAFDGTQTVTVTGATTCGGCTSAGAVFTPG